jgi:phosphotransferase system HPr-like phosphotransfer protein/mannitol/fructose-specific phosphotransferase system IIA component (Ntr-type)
MTGSQEFQNDVFLSHNSKDKPVVRELKRRLAAKGLTVWLDEDELRPGIPWQELLEIGIRSSRSVVVVIGKDGLGPWENEEMQAALILAVDNKRPVIPVLMPGAQTMPRLPMFLGIRTWVDLRTDLNDDGVGRLVWGITGAKPQPSPMSPKLTESEATFGHRVTCKLSCLDKAGPPLHGRPISFLIGLCDKFPHTEFRLSKEDRTSDDLSWRVDMKSLINMMQGAFQDGDTVILEVRGKTEVMASTFLKIALENLDGYADDPAATRAKITTLIDEVSSRIYDPDLDDLDDVIVQKSLEDLLPIDREYRVVAVINDRLHDVSLPMIPLIAKHFGCDLQIGFELPNKGVFLFNMGPQNAYNLERRILDLEIQVGTKITVVASGTRGEEAGAAVKSVLQNLWQCDYWIRSRAKDWDSEAAVSHLINYAREMARHFSPAYGHVQNPFISNLITRSVFVNTAGQSFSKELALEQLAASHARLYDLPLAEILKRVKEVERKQTVVPRPGFAIAHAAMERSPRISISFGVYPDGVLWSKEDGMVKLVAMVLCAHDTYKTWRDYLKRFSILFRSVPSLQSQLVSTRKSAEFVDVLRTAEVSLMKV